MPLLIAIRRRLESKRAILCATLLGVILCSPSLFAGLQTEDWIFREISRGQTVDLPWRVNLWPPRPDAVVLRKQIEFEKSMGGLPWLTSSDFHVSMWRPIASLTHHLDYRVWPEAPLLMHAQSLAWYALLILAVGRLYRRLLDRPWVYGLGVVLYAIDDAHGHAVGWLSNRSAVIATVFGIAAIYWQDRWRRDGAMRGAVLAPLLLLLALGSSEFALGAVGYLLAHALVLDTGSMRRRLVGALPWLLAVACWAFVYRALGHGASGSGSYVDPWLEPARFAGVLLQRGLVLLFAQWTGVPSETFSDLAPTLSALLLVGAAGLCCALGVLLWPIVKSRSTVAFWALGMLLATIPACCAEPEDRLLFWTGLGAMALIAELVLRLSERKALLSRGRWRGALTLAGVAALLHVALGLVLLPPRSLTMTRLENELALARGSAYGLMRRPDVELVLLNAPSFFFCTMVFMTRAARGESLPLRNLCLSGSPGPVELYRTDAHTLEVRPRGGFVPVALSKLYLAPGRKVEAFDTPGFEARVIAKTAAGEPLAARYRFGWPIGDEHLVFAAFRQGRYVRATLPAVGQRMILWP